MSGSVSPSGNCKSSRAAWYGSATGSRISATRPVGRCPAGRNAVEWTPAHLPAVDGQPRVAQSPAHHALRIPLALGRSEQRRTNISGPHLNLSARWLPTFTPPPSKTYLAYHLALAAV